MKPHVTQIGNSRYNTRWSKQRIDKIKNTKGIGSFRINNPREDSKQVMKNSGLEETTIGIYEAYTDFFHLRYKIIRQFLIRRF